MCVSSSLILCIDLLMLMHMYTCCSSVIICLSSHYSPKQGEIFTIPVDISMGLLIHAFQISSGMRLAGLYIAFNPNLLLSSLFFSHASVELVFNECIDDNRCTICLLSTCPISKVTICLNSLTVSGLSGIRQLRWISQISGSV